MYFVLILGLIIISFIALVVFKWEIMCPPVIVCLMFTFTSFFGLFTYDDFNYSEFSIRSTIFILMGILSFFTGSWFVYLYYCKKYSLNEKEIVEIKRKRLEPGLVYNLIAFGLEMVTLIWAFVYMRGMVVSRGYSIATITLIIQRYHIFSQYLNDVNEPVLLGAMINYSAVFGIISLFIFIHNKCFQCSEKKDFIHIIIAFLWLSISVLRSNRGNLLIFLSALMYFLFIFWKMYDGWKLDVDKKICKTAIIMAILFIVLFMFLMVFMGRHKSLADINIMRYLSTYISCPIRNFDLFLKDSLSNTQYIGSETFYSIYRSFYRLLGYGDSFTRHLEFRSINGLNTGNIYTAFRRFYSDFGMTGMIVLSSIQGMIFTMGYMHNKKNAYRMKLGFGLLLYGYLSYTVFYLPIDDVLYSSVLSIGTPIRILVMYLLYYYVTKIKLRFGKKVL